MSNEKEFQVAKLSRGWAEELKKIERMLKVDMGGKDVVLIAYEAIQEDKQAQKKPG